MARPKKQVVDTVDTVAITQTKRDKTPYEEKLWCEKCQRGVDGYPGKAQLTEGDICPMCLQRYRFRKDKNEISGRLKTIGLVVKEKQERAEFVIKERERNAIKGIKDADDLVRESEERLRRENDDLRKQLDELRELITKK
jgi:hypothetical protein